METCSLCQAPSVELEPELRPSDGRTYFLCPECDLIFVAGSNLPTLEREKQRYELHDNDPGNTGYRAFLARAVECLRPHLQKGARGLDYGCGPSPVLASLFDAEGFPTAFFDPIFHKNSSPLGETYDFVTCTEAAEHFHRPREEFARLDSLLRLEGWLAVMTKRIEDRRAFRDWHYHRDPTHVCFYSIRTMNWLAQHHRWRCSVVSPDIVLFQKKSR